MTQDAPPRRQVFSEQVLRLGVLPESAQCVGQPSGAVPRVRVVRPEGTPPPLPRGPEERLRLGVPALFVEREGKVVHGVQCAWVPRAQDTPLRR